ncbi:MAG: NAD-dependent epimerase/dehydratase family protein [Chloroflexi bacterium]|nr:NAD-dependent epimerase/dehydratase family protein [Chloroflexota bacterium]
MTAGAKRVAVTGAAGYVGSQLIRYLDSLDEIDMVLATDIRPLRQQFSGKVKFVHHDVTEPMANLFRHHGVEAVAHLAFILNPSRDHERLRSVNVGGSANVMQSCVDSGVRHLVCLGSTTVYGAHSDNPALLTEESPLRPVKGFQYSETKAEVDGLLQDFAASQSGITVSLLRSCPVVGPNANNFVAKTFSRSTLVAIRGYNPQMQFLHEDDITSALAHCLLNKVEGVYNVGGGGGIGWEEMARISGKRLVKLPARLLYGLTGLTWGLHLQNSSPACGLDFIRYPFLASTEKLEREHGIKAKHSSRQAWQAFAGSRRLWSQQVSRRQSP